MGYFKLSLLDYTLNNTSNAVKFLPSTVSEFYPQMTVEQSKTNLATAKHSFCYTYGESLSLHSNAQKEFSFSIDKMILKDNEWLENPFFRYMIIGTQLLLEDNYHNQYFFTIQDIGYTFKKQNTTASITCQDSFSYQLSRQNDGYSIENDSSSEDFIGSKDVDWWIENKIHPDCHISYEYLPLGTGLYLDSDNRYQLFTNTADLMNVKRIIKPAYDYATYPEYYETFAYNGSGNAASLLIDVSSKVGLNVKTYEHASDNYNNYFVTYYWVEPIKKEEESGLYYSPNTNVQNFSLKHSGASLTTVLNVTGPTYDDEVITLLPELTPFFLQAFHSVEWSNSEWIHGLFTELIHGKMYHYNSRSIAKGPRIYHYQSTQTSNVIKSYTIHDSTEKGRYPHIITNVLMLPISDNATDTFTIPSLYTDVRFNTDNNHSQIVIGDTIISSEGHVFRIGYSKPDSSIEYVNENNFDQWAGVKTKQRAWLIIPLTTAEATAITKKTINYEDIYFQWYRTPTADDIAFANIADQIPWLENKLIDFSYFYNHNLLNKEEYQSLMNILYNNLRITNGKLLFYSNEYYTALHEKTRILAELTEMFDTLGANFQADIVTPYASKKKITSMEQFRNSYDSAFKSTIPDVRKKLLNYDKVYSSYVNKYITSNQLFLKNIYNFTEYFNAPTSFFNSNSCVYEDVITLQDGIIEPAENGIYTQYDFVFSEDKNAQYTNISGAEDEDVYNTVDTSDFYGKPLFDIYGIANDKSSSLMTVVYKNCPEWNTLLQADNGFNHEQIMSAKGSSWSGDKNYYQTALQWSITEEQYKQYQKVTRTQDNNYGVVVDETKLSIYPLIRTSAMSQKGDFPMEIRIVVNGNAIIFSRADAELGYIPITTDEMIINYVAKSVVNSTNPIKYYQYIQNNYAYQPLNTLFTAMSKVEKGIKNKQIGFIGINNTSIASINILNYWASLPIENYYYKSHNYVINKINDQLDLETYSVENKKHQSLVYYFEHQDACKNPLDENEWSWQKMPLLIPNKSVNYWYYSYYKNADDNILSNDSNDTAMVASDLDGQNVGGNCYPTSLTETYISTIDVNGLKRYNNYSDMYKKLKATDIFTIEKDSTITCDNSDINPDTCCFDDFSTSPLTGYNVLQDYNGNTLGYLHVANRLNYCTYVNNFIPSLVTLRNADFLDTEDHIGVKVDLNRCAYQEQWYIPLKKGCSIDNTDHYIFIPIATQDNHYQLNTVSNYATPELLQENDYEAVLNNLFLSKSDIYDTNSSLHQTNGTTGQLINNSLQARLVDDYYISHTACYPLSQLGITLSTSTLSKVATDQQLLSENSITQLSDIGVSDKTLSRDYLYRVSVSQKTWGSSKIFYGILCRVEDGLRLYPWSSNANYYNSIVEHYNESTIWYNENHIRVTFTKQSDFCDFYFMDTKANFNLVPAYEFDLKDGVYYSSQKQRLYTAYQLLHSEDTKIKYYRKNNTKLIKQALNNQTLEMTTDVILKISQYCKRFTLVITLNGAQPIEKDSVTLIMGDSQSTLKLTIIDEIVDNNQLVLTAYSDGDIDFHNDDNWTIEGLQVVDIQQVGELQYPVGKTTTKQYALTFTAPSVEAKELRDGYESTDFEPLLGRKLQYKWQGRKIKDLSHSTNGEFWFKYHSQVDQPVLFGYAASIETNLEQYWSAAYSASLNCEYFLPEHWQPSIDGDTNYFSDSVIDYVENNKCAIRRDFMPQVERVFNPLTNNYDMPKYQLTYHGKITTTDHNTLLATQAFQDNQAMKQIAETIGITWDDFVAEKLSDKITTTYYYAVGGGTTYHNLLSQLRADNSNEFINYNGLYIMMIDALRSRCQDYDVSLYEDVKQQHDNLWTQLYKTYPSIILESAYTDSDAVSSQDLMTLATNVFKDKANPERGYTVSLINNIAEYKGYHGQELEIGSSIRLNVDDFYHTYDDIYDSLNQLLFITDIKYNLRKDTDITLTVNSIKYQDKLIQRLAKLIK